MSLGFGGGGSSGGGGGAAENTAVTFKSLTLASPSANTAFLSGTGYSLTSGNGSFIDLAGTWNNAGSTPTAIKLNVTDTASNSGSLFLDLQIGGSSKFVIQKDGSFCSVGGGGGTAGYYTPSASFNIANNISLGWTSTSYMFNTPDLVLNRDSAATLQLGVDHATTPTAQTIKAHDVTTGTGADLILSGGSGSSASGKVYLVTKTLGGGLEASAGDAGSIFGQYSGSNRGSLRFGAVDGYQTILSSEGGNGDVWLLPNGSGKARFGTHFTVGSETITGYIEMKDSGGTLRKLAVIS